MGQRKTVIVDAMSGDNAPGEVVKGAVAGAAACGCRLVLVGDSKVIKDIAGDGDYDVIHTDEVLTMDDAPSSVMREKKNSSLAVSVRLLSEDAGDSLVSAANTGALFTAASLILRRFKGVRRAALGAVVPLNKPFLLLDSGANPEMTADQLLTLAKMGEVYASEVMGIKSPRIGLLNNGTESGKGTEVCREAYVMLRDSMPGFIGNIEGRDLTRGICDVVVTDGFTGNIALKSIEGTAEFAFSTIRSTLGASLRGKIAGALVMRDLRALKQRFNPSAYGGAPFIGISKPVIKAHGAANAQAIEKTISQALAYADAIEIMRNRDYK